MKIDTLRSEFHELIDHIDNPELLAQYYEAITRSVSSENSLWKSLSQQQQQDVLQAYQESEDETNLVSLADIKSKFKESPLK